MNRHYPWGTAPSVRALCEALNIDTARAVLVRGLIKGYTDPMDLEPGRARYRQCYRRPTDEDKALHCIDSILGTHGVEGWATSLREGVSYCNTGDMYAATVAYTPDGWFLGGWDYLAQRFPVDTDY